ncbi:MAG TPA: DNA cytosine methyltransferase [Pyrinomonadaceae bacterium]|nr:DNA cytosine methyltransferase [Pyrinomonadaceae bacterium]
MKKPRAIDLFSGCGGLTLGLKQAGFRVIGAVECDTLAATTYKANHPSVRVWTKDIRTVSVAEIKRKLRLKRGQLDLLAGCPPCQGFSTITTRNGNKKRSTDPRNDLVFEFMRFVRGLRPKAIMLENVPGLAKNWRLRKILAELRRQGYECTTGVLNAADYGVPQRRRRFILMAGHRMKIEFAREARSRQLVRDAIKHLSKRTRTHALHNYKERRSQKVIKRIKQIPPNGGSRSALDKKAQLKCHKKSDGFRDVYGRMAWDDVAPTITTGCFNPSKGRFLHPTRHRAITLREAALLQSFPKTYFFSLERGRIAVAEMIGNALPPEFIRRHAKNVARTLYEKV